MVTLPSGAEEDGFSADVVLLGDGVMMGADSETTSFKRVCIGQEGTGLSTKTVMR